MSKCDQISHKNCQQPFSYTENLVKIHIEKYHGYSNLKLKRMGPHGGSCGRTSKNFPVCLTGPGMVLDIITETIMCRRDGKEKKWRVCVSERGRTSDKMGVTSVDSIVDLFLVLGNMAGAVSCSHGVWSLLVKTHFREAIMIKYRLDAKNRPWYLPEL